VDKPGPCDGPRLTGPKLLQKGGADVTCVVVMGVVLVGTVLVGTVAVGDLVAGGGFGGLALLPLNVGSKFGGCVGGADTKKFG
jgi:hypothetical protein